MSAIVRKRLFAGLRVVRGPAILVVSYLLTRLAFAALTEDGGLVTPEGKPSLGVAALGVAVLALRLSVLFGIPGLIAYRATMRVLERARSRADAPETASTDPAP